MLLGPIPKGIPVGLLSNLKLRAESDDLGDKAAHVAKISEFLVQLTLDLATAPAGASDAELRQRFANLKAPMMALSKCKDFVVNRGHYFGTDEVNEQDGRAGDEKVVS